MTLATVTAWLASEITAAARGAGFPSEPIVACRRSEVPGQEGAVHVAVEFVLPADAVELLVAKLNGRD